MGVINRGRVQTHNDQPSMTVQSDAELADIHAIIRKYSDRDLQAHLDNVDAVFLDVTQFDDYQDVMIYARQAEQEFNKLPPQVRLAFDNDAAVWLDTAHDPEKRAAIQHKLDIALGRKSDVELDQTPLERPSGPPAEDSGPTP